MINKMWFWLLVLLPFNTVTAGIGVNKARPSIEIAPQTGEICTRTLGRERIDGHLSIVIEAIPKSRVMAEALGYGRALVWVDIELKTMRKAELLDRHGQRITSIYFREIERSEEGVRANRVEIFDHVSKEMTIVKIGEEENVESPLISDTPLLQF